MGSDVIGLECPACRGLPDLSYIDFANVELRIMANLDMDTTLYDAYGTLDKAVEALKSTLKGECEWENLSGLQKFAFQEWVEKNARVYKDGDKVDWIGAFYDWLEEQ